MGLLAYKLNKEYTFLKLLQQMFHSDRGGKNLSSLSPVTLAE